MRKQGLNALAARFGADAAEVKRVGSRNNAQNARIHVATYQTLGVSGDEEEGDAATFLQEFYPKNHFSHIVIDECHRSAWGKWHEVLARNPNAVQIGLTATPRKLEISEDSEEARQDERIRADNIRDFGEPVYEYDIAQGIEDGFLAACEIVRRDVFIDAGKAVEEQTGLDPDASRHKLSDGITGQAVGFEEAEQHYDAGGFENRIELPERTAAMCRDLFDHLLATGGPEQKTIIFCARDAHADRVSAEMNNLYAAWAASAGQARRPIRLQVHGGFRRSRFPARPEGCGAQPFHRLHGRFAHHRRRRAVAAQCRVLPLHALADPGREDSERSWTVSREEIEKRNFDLKAVNPNRKAVEDTRTPIEIVDEIGARSCEIDAAMAELRRLLA